MKFKILSTVLLISLYISESHGSKNECPDVNERSSLQTAATITVPAEIFSLADLGDKASIISYTRGCIEKYPHFVQQKINQLKTLVPAYAFLGHPLEELSSFPIEEATSFIKRLGGFREFIGVELENYFALSKILTGQYCESASSLLGFPSCTGAFHISYLEIPWVNLRIRPSLRICSKYTIANYGEIIDKFVTLQNLKRLESYRQDLLARWQLVVSDKIPNAVRIFFQNSAPILYKAVEDVSKHSKGRLAGVALYSDWNSISIVLGRKGLAVECDDPDIHVERELSKKLLGNFGRTNSGHLFVYCPYAPCNKVKDSGKISCLQFYHNLVQENPGLNVTVFFDKPFKTGNDFWSRNPRLTLFDLSTNNQFTEPLPPINLSLLTSGAPELLQRARSGEIVNCLLPIPLSSLQHIVKKMKTSDERRDRIQNKVLKKQRQTINKRRKMRKRAE